MKRIMSVVRVHMINKWTFLWLPLVMLFGAAVLTLIVFSMIPGKETLKYAGGASLVPIWYFIGIGSYARTLTFPFVISLGVTRREFYLGSLVTAFFAAIGLGGLFSIGAIIEDATNGWDMNGYFFRIPGLWEAMGPGFTALLYFALIMFMFAIGFLCASVYKRWGSITLTVSLLLLGILIAGAALLITKANAWGAVGDFFITVGAGGVFAILAALTVVMLVGAYAPLRRSIP